MFFRKLTCWKPNIKKAIIFSEKYRLNKKVPSIYEADVSEIINEKNRLKTSKVANIVNTWRDHFKSSSKIWASRNDLLTKSLDVLNFDSKCPPSPARIPLHPDVSMIWNSFGTRYSSAPKIFHLAFTRYSSVPKIFHLASIRYFSFQISFYLVGNRYPSSLNFFSPVLVNVFLTGTLYSSVPTFFYLACTR